MHRKENLFAAEVNGCLRVKTDGGGGELLATPNASHSSLQRQPPPPLPTNHPGSAVTAKRQNLLEDEWHLKDKRRRKSDAVQ